MDSNNKELSSIWENTIELLRRQYDFDEVTIDSYYRDAEIFQLNPLKATVIIPTRFALFVLEAEKEKIQNALRQSSGYPKTEVDLFCKDDLNNVITVHTPAVEEDNEDSNLIPEFRFDNFVEGPSNRESYQAALACASKPQGFLYSPLYIYGDSGLGKTHLLHAIGNYIHEHNPQLRILYLTSDEFITRVVSASRENRLKELKEEMMSLDVFLLDDIQFLGGGKVTSSETLFNIYNSLQRKKKLIVITSDKKPWEIKELEERLVSRLSNGLTCSIDSPEYETALEILKMKISNRTEEVEIEESVLSYIAKYYSHDVRALEGRLTRLIFYSLQFGDNRNITYDLAMEAFRDDDISNTKKELSISLIQKIVADYYNISKQQLLSKDKSQTITTPRAVAIYLCRKHTNASFTRLGDEFGRRDHSTIMSAYRKIEENLPKDAALSIAVTEIEKQF